MTIRDLAMLAGGAVLATAATVSVYETRGARAFARPEAVDGRSASDHDDAQGEVEASSVEVASATGSPPPSEPPASARGAAGAGSPKELEKRLDGVQREKVQLETRLHALESRVGRRDSAHAATSPERYVLGAPEEFELDQEDWKKLAAEGRVKYKIPCLLPPGSPWTPQPDTLDELGLSPEDGEVIAEAHRRSTARLWEVIRPLCEEAITDPATVDLLGGQGCLRVIRQLSDARAPGKATEAQRQVAEIHAGLRPRPASDQPQEPLFWTYLALTSENALFEADLAQSFGPEEAKRIARSDGCSATQR